MSKRKRCKSSIILGSSNRDRIGKRIISKVYSKVEAIGLMMEGNKMSHTSFSNNEYVGIRDHYYYFANGLKCLPEQFWNNRVDEKWETGWIIKL